MNNINIKPINCKKCGTPLNENPTAIEEYEHQCPKCQSVWLAKPVIVWAYYEKFIKKVGGDNKIKE